MRRRGPPCSAAAPVERERSPASAGFTSPLPAAVVSSAPLERLCPGTSMSPANESARSVEPIPMSAPRRRERDEAPDQPALDDGRRDAILTKSRRPSTRRARTGSARTARTSPRSSRRRSCSGASRGGAARRRPLEGLEDRAEREPVARRPGGRASGRVSGSPKKAHANATRERPAATSPGSAGLTFTAKPPIAGPNTKPRPNAIPTRPMPRARSPAASRRRSRPAPCRCSRP